MQFDNVNFSDAIQKLTEKNIKLKQEVIGLSNENKKYTKALKQKNDSINRQKSLIEMFQNNLSGSSEFSIVELQRKKEELEIKIANEKDFLKKLELKREKQDCERRLSDFTLFIVNSCFLDLNHKK